jgi:hypothetical protein
MGLNRREVLQWLGWSSLGAGSWTLLAGTAEAKPSKAGDIAIMNAALSIEHQGIWAYGAALASGLLSEQAREVAGLFQGSHEGHRDLLSQRILDKGGRPIAPLPSYRIPIALQSEADVVEYAFRLEVAAAHAYMGSIGRFEDRSLVAGAVRIISDEVMHSSMLRSLLGREIVPNYALIEN